jgi:hypothetical protein
MCNCPQQMLRIRVLEWPQCYIHGTDPNSTTEALKAEVTLEPQMQMAIENLQPEPQQMNYLLEQYQIL